MPVQDENKPKKAENIQENEEKNVRKMTLNRLKTISRNHKN